MITVIPGRVPYSRESMPQFSFKSIIDSNEFYKKLERDGSCSLQYGEGGPLLVFGQNHWLDANDGWVNLRFDAKPFFWRAPKFENPIDRFKGRIVAQQGAIIAALKERRGTASDYEYTKYKIADFVIRVFPFPDQGILYLVSFSKHYIGAGANFKAMPTARIDIESETITKFFALLKPARDRKNYRARLYQEESNQRVVDADKYLKDCSHVHREIAYVYYKEIYKLIAPLATHVGTYACYYDLETAQKYLQFALGVATGIAQIHAKGFCVGDIKSNNCLFDGVWKIADFSLHPLGKPQGLKQSLAYVSPQHLQFLQSTIGQYPAHYRNKSSSCLLDEFDNLNYEDQIKCFYAISAQDEVYSLGILLIEVYYGRIKEGLSSLPEETLTPLARMIWRMTGVNVKVFPTLRSVFDVIDPVPPLRGRTEDPRLGSSYFHPEERPSAQEVADYFNALLSRESPMA